MTLGCVIGIRVVVAEQVGMVEWYCRGGEMVVFGRVMAVWVVFDQTLTEGSKLTLGWTGLISNWAWE